MQHSTATATERRTHRRLRVGESRAWVDVRVASGPSLRVPVRDISVVGLLVEVPLELLEAWPGLRSQVELALHLDDTHRIESGGEVAWMGGEVFDRRRRYRAGLAFSALTGPQRRLVEDWMDRLPE